MACLDQTAWGITVNFTFVLIIAFGEIVPLSRLEFEHKAYFLNLILLNISEICYAERKEELLILVRYGRL